MMQQGTETARYGALVDELFSRQMRNWPDVAARYAALARVHTRTLTIGQPCGGSAIVLQCNPERIISSAAKTDAASLKARRCFLCGENQPREQERVMWHDSYKIQVNPYPIFPRHLTISCMEHTPQTIVGRVAHMTALACDLQGWVVFYNGPRCGASAPDHMHFQAGNADFLPVLREVGLMPQRELYADATSRLCLVQGLSRPVMLVSATSAERAAALTECLLSAMPLREGDPEPMMNVLSWSTGGDEVRVAVFPRRKHRPDCYGQGQGQLLLSPASVDMGGVWAVPRIEDYERLTSDIVQQLLGELCSTELEMETIINNLNFTDIK